MTPLEYVAGGCLVFSTLCCGAGLIFWTSFKKEADRMGNVMFAAAAVSAFIALVIVLVTL